MFEQEGRRENGGNFDRCLGFTHVIKKGDTLYKLSRQYNVKVSALILANPYADVYNLQIGDEICIPKIRPVVIPITPYPQVRPYPPARPYEGGMPRQMTEETPARQGEEIPEEEGISEEFMDGMDEMENSRRTIREEGGIGAQSGGSQTEEEEQEQETVLQEVPCTASKKVQDAIGDAPNTDMTVGELLEQWDISPQLLGQCLEILKKM